MKTYKRSNAAAAVVCRAPLSGPIPFARVMIHIYNYANSYLIESCTSTNSHSHTFTHKTITRCFSFQMHYTFYMQCNYYNFAFASFLLLGIKFQIKYICRFIIFIW